MKILDKYIFSSFIASFLFSCLFLCVIFVIGDIFGFLDEILREKISAMSLLYFYLYMMPLVITQVMPVSCLLATVFLLGNLNRHNEITALKASGISLIKILSPIILTSLLAGAVIFIINDRMVPSSMRLANKIRYEKLEVGKQGTSKILKNIAIYGRGNRMIFTKKFDTGKNILEDVIIHAESEDGQSLSKISARSIVWTGGKWMGKDVVTYNINRFGDFAGTPVIRNEEQVNIEETPLDFINNQWQPQYMGYKQLKEYLDVFLGGSKLAQRRFTVELNYKIALPFSCLAMILIASPFTLVTRRGAALIGMAQGIVIALIYIPLVAVGLALGKRGILDPMLAAWLANLVLGGTGLYLILKK